MSEALIDEQPCDGRPACAEEILRLETEVGSLRSAITAVTLENHAATEGIIALHIMTTEWVGGVDSRKSPA